MLNSRNLTAMLIVLAMVSLAAMLVGLLAPPDNDGMGDDSYGTRAYGQRALHDLLLALNAPAERNLLPPEAQLGRPVTLALLAPVPELLALESDYLERMRDWVRGGGRLAVALRPQSAAGIHALPGRHPTSPEDVLALLGLDGLQLVSTGGGDGDEEPNLRGLTDTYARESGWVRYEPAPRLGSAAGSEGVFAGMGPSTVLQLPLESTAGLRWSTRPADGITTLGLVRARRGGEEMLLAAAWQVGAGSISVLAEHRLLTNEFLGLDDNPVLAVHWLGAAGPPPYLIDEFYHGLSVRGNPAWLLTRFPYGLLALTVALTGGLFVWRGAVRLGPPLAEQAINRRTLAEYLDAMAGLFSGRRSRAFIARELLEGGCWALRRRLRTVHSQADLELLAGVLERRDPQAAERLRSAGADLARLAEAPAASIEANQLVRAAAEFQRCTLGGRTP